MPKLQHTEIPSDMPGYEHCWKFEEEKFEAYVYFNKRPGKEELEEPCRKFYRKVLEDEERRRIENEKKATVGSSDSRNDWFRYLLLHLNYKTKRGKLQWK